MPFPRHLSPPADPRSPAPSRRGFLAAALAGGAAGAAVLSQPELAGAAFPPGVEKFFVTKFDIKRFFKDVQDHENDHVEFIKTALGSAARPRPTFKNLRPTSFALFANLTRAFENAGVGAYLGAAPAIKSPGILAAAGSIATVEARHAGFVNVALSSPVVPGDNSFDEPLSPMEVQDAVAPFVESPNGGPPLTYSSTPSDENDAAILNFALALEYLEAEFYNINVPRFFG